MKKLFLLLFLLPLFARAQTPVTMQWAKFANTGQLDSLMGKPATETQFRAYYSGAYLRLNYLRWQDTIGKISTQYQITHSITDFYGSKYLHGGNFEIDHGVFYVRPNSGTFPYTYIDNSTINALSATGAILLNGNSTALQYNTNGFNNVLYWDNTTASRQLWLPNRGGDTLATKGMVAAAITSATTDTTGLARKTGSADMVQKSYKGNYSLFKYSGTNGTPPANYAELSFDAVGSEKITKSNGDVRLLKFRKGGNDTVYFPYKNNSTLADSADLYGVNNGIKTNLQTLQSNLIAANSATFADGSGVSYLKAAPAYGGISFIADTWYAMHGSPSSFSSAYIIALANKYIAAKDGSGNFPIYLNGTTGVAGFISGCDVALFRPTGDGAFFIPSLYLLYYQKSGDINQFNTHGSELKTALDQIPLDGNGLVTISTTAAQNWVPWGFQDGVRSTGANLMGTLLYYKACVDMATMYTANGQTALATTMTARATTIASNITASLWDSTDGMFYNAGTNNRQIDILGSAYAAYLGVATSSQITAISTYLVANYATLTKAGYIRQSPTNWAFSWQGNQCNRGTGNYDDGFWSVGNEWVSFAMAQTSTNTANRYVNDFITTYDPTQEYYGNSTLAPVSGVTNNSESPAGTLAYVSGAVYPQTGTIARFVSGAPANLNDPIVSLGGNTIGPGKRQLTTGGDGSPTGTILSTTGKITAGINAGSLSARLIAAFPGNQITAAYDSTHFTLLNTDISGNFTITPSNGNVTNTGSLTVTGALIAGIAGRNFYSPSSSSAVSTTTAQLTYGGVGTNFIRVGFYGANSTSLTTGAESAGYIFGASPITTFTSGTHPYISQVVVRPVVITNAGATVATAATFINYGRASGAINNYVQLNYNDAGSGTNNTWFKYGITRVSGLQIDSTATAPTATAGTNTTQLATTAFVQTATNQTNLAGKAIVIQSSADLTAQTTAGNITTFTVGASNATFAVAMYVNVTAVATDVIQGQVTYTDENNTAQTVSLTSLSTVTNSQYSPVIIRCKAGTVITAKTNLTTGIGSITFDAGARINQL